MNFVHSSGYEVRKNTAGYSLHKSDGFMLSVVVLPGIVVGSIGDSVPVGSGSVVSVGSGSGAVVDSGSGVSVGSGSGVSVGLGSGVSVGSGSGDVELGSGNVVGSGSEDAVGSGGGDCVGSGGRVPTVGIVGGASVEVETTQPTVAGQSQTCSSGLYCRSSGHSIISGPHGAHT